MASDLGHRLAVEKVRSELADRRAQQGKSKLRLLQIELEAETIRETMTSVDGVIAGLQGQLRDLGADEEE